jgi:high-affinity iron transporter
VLAALVIVFREVLEAGLIIGVVLAASRGVAGRNRAVLAGILAGVVGAIVVAGFAARISEMFDGRGQELFTAGVLLLAVAMLTWHVAWMADHARDLTRQLRQLGSDVMAGSKSLAVLAVAVAMAVLREGSEVVLFLTGILMQGQDGATDLLLGSAGGLMLGALVSGVIYFGLAAIPLKRMFSVTGMLVTFLAAGLAAEAAKQLSDAGLLNVLDTPLWNSAWLLSEASWPGRVLHVLIGYRDQPTGIQLTAYLATVAAIIALSRSRSPAGGAAAPRPSGA